jgi:hypothetical protein
MYKEKSYNLRYLELSTAFPEKDSFSNPKMSLLYKKGSKMCQFKVQMK